ncbi:unnamed protein product [Pleuronectes platessa]|uniref:Uncharacterized protein n=1 Tax=Pleuronectes platessa TaxID=8262 RepID=A0A9N7Z1Y4_PLEPL|nr:unnamed protein product [Pleuronectes platessa]
MESGWFSSCSGGVPCLRRSRALLYRARSNRCYSDPISAPAQIKLRAAASRFSMALRGETASSLTACPPLSLPSLSGFVSLSSGVQAGPAVASLSVCRATDAARPPPLASQIHLKERATSPFDARRLLSLSRTWAESLESCIPVAIVILDRG